MTVAQIHNFGNPETRLSAENQWLKYDGIDNAANILYSFFTGFVYTPGQTSVCSDTIMTYISSWVNSFDTIKKIYLPYNWPNFQVVLQDVIAAGDVVVSDCDLNKLFINLSHMFSREGIAELGGRVAGSAPFELLQMINTFKDKESSKAEKARQVGKLTATITNWHI